MFFTGMGATQSGTTLLTFHQDRQQRKQLDWLQYYAATRQHGTHSITSIHTDMEISSLHTSSFHKISESNTICHYHSLCDDWELSFLRGWQYWYHFCPPFQQSLYCCGLSEQMDGKPEQLGVAPLLLLFVTYGALATWEEQDVNSALCNTTCSNAINLRSRRHIPHAGQ